MQIIHTILRLFSYFHRNLCLVQTAIDTKKTGLHLTHLPHLAKFIYDRHLSEYAAEYLDLARKIELPMLRYFVNLPEEEMLQFSLRASSDFLQQMASGKISEHIQFARERWLSDQLPRLSRDQVLAQDISSISYIRKQTFLKFISRYTSDTDSIIALVKDIDEYILQLENVFWDTYISVLNERIDEREEQLKQTVTELRKSEREARESHVFIQKVADATPSIITSYNINTGVYRFVSQGLNQLLGYDPEQPLQEGVMFFINLIHPEDIGPLMELNAQELAEANNAPPGAAEPIAEFEYRVRHKNGEYRWLHTYGTVFDRNSEGKVEHILNISIDVTFRKEMETVLSQKNLQLEQSNANLEEFAYVASHDLKEPLRKISIFGDRLLSTHYQHLGNEGQFYLEKIIDSSRKMQVLINDLLSLSLITGNKSFVNYSLQAVLEEVMHTLEFKIEEKGAVIESSQLPEANIIPSQMRQLFQNLITNSLKFTRDGVRPVIHVSARRVLPGEASLHKLSRSKRYLEISFTDNGIGFDNMFAAKIFAIFQRLHHKEYEGTGIGLAICKKIVENHEGVIYAAGEPGSGATFTFVIPQ